MNVLDVYSDRKRCVEAALSHVVSDRVCDRLRTSMNYSLLGSGKRLRPVLYLSVLDAYGAVPCAADFDVACAVECIHAYSLIHDDLPAMDNDDYRRGAPTNHKKFGEAIAVLAGDGLLNLAFELLAKAVVSDPKYAAVLSLIAENAGALGMVGGQAMELTSDLSSADESFLSEITRLKTGKLIEAAVLAGCFAAERGEDREVWTRFALSFGKAFQLCDDLLDSSAGEQSLVELWGEEKSRGMLEEYYASAISALDMLSCDTRFLREFCEAVLLRTTDGLS